VTMDRESLVVRGSTESVQRQDVELVFSEIQCGTYLREFTLGRGIDRDKIDATYERGVLTLRLPKNESLKPREITVR
ncbi:MAG: Hsp20/alpha crystallin family protein, partial [Bacteroidetes bacterium]|nr:Hsp20/alpha crystallin family protein [Bacteroidota bacterium]